MGRRSKDERPDKVDAQRHDLGIEGYAQGILVGQGGFGNVYKCYDPKFERTVAVKVLAAPALDENVRRRFETECRSIGALSGHPHIAAVYDSGINQWGRPYIVMEFMPGGSLADAVAPGRPMEPAAVVDVGVKIAGAVAAAHRVGIQHRDVKPENILVSSFNEPKLCDFGISKLADGTQTRSGIVTASVTHTAPEIFDGAPASASSDLYSLGSTLFELLAGRPAFEVEERSIASVVLRIMNDPVPDLRDSGVPPAVCSAVERAMAKDPADRFASADELREALAAAGEMTLAPPVAVTPAPARRARKPKNASATLHHARHALVQRPAAEEPRHTTRPRIMVAAAVVTLLLVAAGGTIVMRGKTERARAVDPASATKDTLAEQRATPKPSPRPSPKPAPPEKQPPVTAATKSIALGFRKENMSLHGRLASPRDVCTPGRVVRIMRVSPGADEVVGTRRTEPSGWWTLRRPHADGTFYVSIPRAERKLPTGRSVVCGALRSTRFTRHLPAPAKPVDAAADAAPTAPTVTEGGDDDPVYVPPVTTPNVNPVDPGVDPGETVEDSIEKGLDLW